LTLLDTIIIIIIINITEPVYASSQSSW